MKTVLLAELSACITSNHQITTRIPSISTLEIFQSESVLESCLPQSLDNSWVVSLLRSSRSD